ncbi:MAG: site-2 protease family protein [Phycisphaerales bacterium]|nr:site-2 protease family protein [Phycisphaerales bacterium]
MAEWSLMNPGLLAITETALAWAETIWTAAKVIIGFSFIIFVHEMGHFLAAKWVGIRVDRFAVGFGPRMLGWRRGEGLTFGARPNYSASELVERNFGETDYCFRALPLGGYVKMLGEDDILVDEKTGEMKLGNDPRAFPSRPVGQRLIVASAGVVFNLLFAALLLMCVFLVGTKATPPIVGGVEPDSPASRAGLLPGDRIIAIDGNSTDTFNELLIAPILADDALRLRVKRDGQILDQELVVQIEAGTKDRSIGVFPARSTIVDRTGKLDGEANLPQPDDRVTHVNDAEVTDGAQIDRTFAMSAGRPVRLRIQPALGGAPVEYALAPTILISPASQPQDLKPDAVISYRHVLGLLPRRVVTFVNENDPADRAGIRPGDVIAAWGPIANPRFAEVVAVNQEFANRKLRVSVDRAGQRVDIDVTPKRPMFGSSPAKVGAIMVLPETGRPIIADTLPDTPAAEMKLPRGALIIAVDGQPVADWFDVIRVFEAAAGRVVRVTYRVGEQDATASLRVPSSIVNELGLPRAARILSIDGEKSIKRDQKREDQLPSPDVVRRLLAERVGKTVVVRYQPDPLAQDVRTGEFAVRDDNIDPWQLRIEFGSPIAFQSRKEPLTANGNPFKAMYMGVEVTYDVVVTVLYSMKQSAKSGSAMTENVSGPVGIIGMAMEIARTGFSDLLFFLAFLSANLAVFNLLPIPIMDGGLIMFLLIEKIKGKPLSLKTQMISTIVGLAVILLMVVVVTIQDVAKLL